MNSIVIKDSALERILEIRQKPQNQGKFLRISVSGGGCSGFQYLLNLDDKRLEDDVIILKKDEEILAISDQVSSPFLENAEVEFIKELGASYFKVINPNAKTSCGCGSSFSV